MNETLTLSWAISESFIAKVCSDLEILICYSKETEQAQSL